MSDDSLSSPAPDHQKPVRKGWGITGALLLGASAFVAPQFLLVPFVPFIQSLGFSENTASFVLMLAFELVTISLVVAFVYAYGHRLPHIGLGRFEPKHMRLAALGFLAYFAITIVISNVVSLIFTYDEDQVQQLGFSASGSSLEMTLIFMSLVVLAPFAEELLFRGFIFSGIRRRLGPVITAVIVSVLFALVHFQVNVGLDVFALSLVLCYVREKTGSLWPCMALHAAKNGLAFLLLFVYGINA